MSRRFIAVLILLGTSASELCFDANCDAHDDLPDDDAAILLQKKDVSLSVASARGSDSSMAMEAEDLELLQADPFQRVWVMCKGPKFSPQSPLEEVTGVKHVNQMDCTTEMTFKGLCCAPWESGLHYSRRVFVELEAAQMPPGSADTIDEPKASTVFALCTEESAGGVVAAKGDADVARSQVQCVKRLFKESELSGGKGPGGPGTDMSPGEIVLQERIRFLAKQGIPVDSIPMCSAKVNQCPNGKPPVTVKGDFKDKIKLDRTLLASGSGVTMGTVAQGFNGALMTSGSFTMMASGGD